MSFIITLLIGGFLGFKLKGALILYKETRNIKYIQAVVKHVLDEKEIEIIRTKLQLQTERENEKLEKEYKKPKFKMYRSAAE